LIESLVVIVFTFYSLPHSELFVLVAVRGFSRMGFPCKSVFFIVLVSVVYF